MEYVDWTVFTWVIGIMSATMWNMNRLLVERDKAIEEKVDEVCEDGKERNRMYVDIQKALSTLTTNVEWIKKTLESKQDK